MNSYWMSNPQTGMYAQMAGAAERDRWTAWGYAESGEPGPHDFVWMRHPDIAEPARFAWGSRAYWLARGFAPGAPPNPVDLTVEPTLSGATPAPATPSVSAAKSAAEKSERE